MTTRSLLTGLLLLVPVSALLTGLLVPVSALLTGLLVPVSLVSGVSALLVHHS